ncbi:hypothetical protein RhiirA4_484040 [Rhizophagus irregularis]|uniref:Uncharacterized protein n=1 Tax=Rhizophagus irregularis TaxID=588596 RepID=A0A2I1HNE8_9GLOM|nr:hypothetical protein RhiirA4_484040 [Rhizophagus irregularis]
MSEISLYVSSYHIVAKNHKVNETLCLIGILGTPFWLFLCNNKGAILAHTIQM